MTGRTTTATICRLLTLVISVGLCAYLPPLMLTVPADHNARVQQSRSAALLTTMRHAAPLIKAIEQYTADHGEPPSDLDHLLPRYLSSLPDAGPLAKDGWRYSAGESAPEGAEWSLWVVVRHEYSPRLWSFGDVFAYHPTGEYPRAAYGGILDRAGRWGYYYE